MVKNKGKKKIRKPELIKFRAIYLTEDGYIILRHFKKIFKQSMMRILDNLIKKEYGDYQERKKRKR